MAGHVGAGLGKRREQFAQLIARDSDAGIPHRAFEHQPLAIPRLHAQVDLHFTALGELDRIANQIHQHLFQTQGVALEQRRQSSGRGNDKFDALVRCGLGEQIGQLVEQRLRRKFLYRQHQLASLDLRQIEDVVDDGQQRMRGTVNLLEVFQPAGVGGGAQRQIGKADDGVHRRAQLVAHLGQELAFGRGRGAGDFTLARQLLALAPRADVRQHAVVALHLPRLVAHGASRQHGPEHAAVAAFQRQLVAADLPLFAQGARHGFTVLFAQRQLRAQIGHRLDQCRRRGIPQHRRQRRIDAFESPLWRGLEHPLEQVLHHALIALQVGYGCFARDQHLGLRFDFFLALGIDAVAQRQGQQSDQGPRSDQMAVIGQKTRRQDSIRFQHPEHDGHQIDTPGQQVVARHPHFPDQGGAAGDHQGQRHQRCGNRHRRHTDAVRSGYRQHKATRQHRQHEIQQTVRQWGVQTGLQKGAREQHAEGCAAGHQQRHTDLRPGRRQLRQVQLDQPVNVQLQGGHRDDVENVIEIRNVAHGQHDEKVVQRHRQHHAAEQAKPQRFRAGMMAEDLGLPEPERHQERALGLDTRIQLDGFARRQIQGQHHIAVKQLPGHPRPPVAGKNGFNPAVRTHHMNIDQVEQRVGKFQQPGYLVRARIIQGRAVPVSGLGKAMIGARRRHRLELDRSLCMAHIVQRPLAGGIAQFLNPRVE